MAEIESLIHLAHTAHEKGDLRSAVIQLKTARVLASRKTEIPDDLHARYFAVHTAIYGNPPHRAD